jgi:hypothetical protein
MPSGEPPAADNPRWMSPPTDERRSGGSARQTVEQARPGAKKAGFRTSPGRRSKPRLFNPWSRVAWTVWPAFSGCLFASRRKGFRPAGRAASSRMNKVCVSVRYRRIRSPHPVAAYPEASACGDGMRRETPKTPRFFITGAVIRKGCRGFALTSLFWLHDERRCYKTHLVPSLSRLFQTGVLWSVTQWRFNKTYPVPQFGQVSMSVVRKIRMTRCGNLRQARSAGDSGKVAHVDPESLSCIVSVLMSAGSGRSAGPVTVL